MADWTRRDFVKFLGGSLAGSALFQLPGCATGEKGQSNFLPFTPLKATDRDDLVLASGFESKLLLSWGDEINPGLKFGFNNDYLAFTAIDGKSDEGVLWVNHEYANPVFTSDWVRGQERTKAMIDKEMLEVGGSLVHLKREDGEWKVIKNSRYNRRLDGRTKIPLISDRAIAGTKTVMGTFANCAGGVTPWNTILSCEENYQDYYGDIDRKSGKTVYEKWDYGWHKFYDGHPHHYGWVVEVNPMTGFAKKLTGLGRFAHECATVRLAEDGRPVVYSGDDKKNEFLYKFIARDKNSLEHGELYVADVKNGRWMSLDIEKQPKLKSVFKDQLDVLIHCREAGRILGATHLDRPEDIEINPRNGDVIVALTNNYDKKDLMSPKNNFHGQVMRLRESNNDPLATTFEAEDMLTGGEKIGFSCPDNLAFDRKGNLWITTDISGSMMNRFPYKSFGNNGLFYVPLEGPMAGKAFQVASAPRDAELTGPYFAPDGETLFLSVQHPGERSKSPKELTSHWPDGADSVPRPSVVQISGRAMKEILS